jgi:tight adherence protein B
MEIVIAAGIFLGVVLGVEGLFFLIQGVRKPEERRVRRRLKTLSSGGYHREEVNIVRKTVLSTIPWFNELLFKIPEAIKMGRFLDQADARYPVGFYLLLSLFLAPVGYLAGLALKFTLLLKILLAVVFCAIPFVYLYVKKNNRMLKFERQLPEALEMIARALKAGHAFPGGLKMASEEFDDPIGTEFERTLEEINFGVGIPDALKNLANRVDCADLKFFVISVIIQRETGGNLAEIMDNLAYLIRERFKLQGRVRVLAAEGKFSAIVLVAIPIFIAIYFYFVQPTYISLLFTDPIGRMMVTAAVIMMVIGSYVMRKMILIKV